MGFLMRIWILLLALSLAACVSAPRGPLSLKQQIDHPSTITLPLIVAPSDLIIVRAGLPDGSTGRFVVDTGATMSAIYPDIKTQLGLEPVERKSIRVHGMITAQLQPTTIMPRLTLGETVLPSFQMAIIPRADAAVPSQLTPAYPNDGIIGMDILSRFHLYIDKPNMIMRLIPTALGAPALPVDWDVVDLTRNPFLEDGRDLHFFQLRLGNGLTPALLDTGSQFNMMNWNTERFPRLRAVQKKLRKDWEIDGAIGTFKPVSKVLSKNARAGQKFWGENEFLVLDFESLNVLGIDGQAFVIAGMPMLSEVAVLIDFENDRLYFAPDGRGQSFITITSG